MPAPHGTRSRYVQGCRCELCGPVARAYARCHYYRTRVLRKISAGIARDHIFRLHAAGMGDNAIADSCGVGPATVRLIRLGRKTAIYRRTQERILSVTPEGIADGALVDAAFTQSLLRELIEEGWKRRQLARALGRKGKNLPELRQTYVTARTQLRVEKLYRRLQREGQLAIPERAA